MDSTTDSVPGNTHSQHHGQESWKFQPGAKGEKAQNAFLFYN
jgi:hypothetical protein